MVTAAVIALVLLLLIGAPIFAVMIGFALLGAMTQPRELVVEFSGQVADVYKIGSNDVALVLSTIPLFIYMGYLMAAARTADRLVRFAQALVGWLPGGLAVVTVFVCAIFTTFTGASGVTIVALGGMVMPALIKQNYPAKFSLGLVAGTGSVGLLFPPALPLFIYGTVYGIAAQMASDSGAGEMKLTSFSTDRFLLAGIVPGLVLIGMLCIYSVGVAVVSKVPRHKFDLGELGRSFIAALPEIAIPVLILVGLGIGAQIPEIAALAALYVLLLETVVFRDIKLKQLWGLTRESMALVGAIFIVILAAQTLTNYSVNARIPNAMVDWIRAHIESRWAFLLMLNLFLLFVGTVMDIFSAIVVVVPFITPAAMQYGVDPYHLGVIFLLNLELGYLHPPIGLNLFITSYKFKRPLMQVVVATFPFLLIMITSLILVTYVPALTVVPPAPRRGSLSQMVSQVAETAKTLTAVAEIKMPDGTTKKLAECETSPDPLEKINCQTLFKDYSACADDACKQAAIKSYVEESGGGEDGDEEPDAGPEGSDAGP